MGSGQEGGRLGIHPGCAAPHYSLVWSLNKGMQWQHHAVMQNILALPEVIDASKCCGLSPAGCPAPSSCSLLHFFPVG